MTNNEILSVLHIVFLHCKINNIDVVLETEAYAIHDTSEYSLGDLRIQENFIIWQYSFKGFVSDTIIMEIFEPFETIEELRITCFEWLSFQKNMSYELHEVFTRIQLEK